MCHTAHLQERMLGFYVNWIEREAHCLSNGAWLTVGVKCVPIFWAPLALEMWLGNLLTRISSLHPPPTCGQQRKDLSGVIYQEGSSEASVRGQCFLCGRDSFSFSFTSMLKG